MAQKKKTTKKTTTKKKAAPKKTVVKKEESSTPVVLTPVSVTPKVWETPKPFVPQKKKSWIKRIFGF